MLVKNHRIRHLEHGLANARHHRTDYRDVDGADVDLLLADLHEEPREAADHLTDHDDEEHRAAVVRLRESQHAGRDIADIWTMTGGKGPLLTAAQELVLAK